MGFPKKPKEMAALFNISSNDLSIGHATLNRLHSMGMLSEYNVYKESRMVNFLTRYIKCLGVDSGSINPNYLGFCSEIIGMSVKYKIAPNNILTTKCAGAIYLMRYYSADLKFSKSEISKVCNISITTYTSFFKIMNDIIVSSDPKYRKARVKILNIFFRNGINLPKL
jgi:hypothetical protein